MKHKSVLAMLAGLGLALSPVMAAAQTVNITRSEPNALPYTLIYPETMEASGGGDAPLIINHPNAPLQCEMAVVAVEDTAWTAEAALSSLDDASVATAWSEALPGFGVSGKDVVAYQDGTALRYEGSSLGSAMGIPVTLVHAETVAGNGGYVLDCIYATDQAEQARPLVDFIVANFSTRADAECCSQPLEEPAAEASPTQ